MTASWYPKDEVLKSSNIYKMMLKNNFDTYDDFWKWSASKKEDFWDQTIKNLGIDFYKEYDTVLDISKGVEHAAWLKGAAFNIVDSCFQNDDDAIAIIYQKEGKSIEKISQKALKKYVNRIANSLSDFGLKPGDRIAIDMPMTLEAVAIYLAGLKAGIPVVTIADSFSPNEIAVRLNITAPKLIFTQDVISRVGKKLPLYKKLLEAHALSPIVVISEDLDTVPLREDDLYFNDFLSENDAFQTRIQNPEDTITVLFSSGTTGEPKAIPWTHNTPIKCASDGYYHHNIQQNDVVCWPTNLGWMMGPWLIFASLINKGTMALYYGAPMGSEFGSFVQDAGVTMLGLVPSIVRQWKITESMEAFDWSKIKCFSSTGEASNPEEMEYLMQLANNKPIIEYCGGTEIGGGYVTSTVVQDNIVSTFSSQALGGEFVLLDENGDLTNQGEMFLIPPIMGLSNSLLNRDHHEVYFKDNPTYQNKVLRKHGDELIQLENGYYKAQGRADDAMNLGGIKVSSVQIEEVINQLEFIKESAAIAISPKNGGPSQLVIYVILIPSDLTMDAQLKMAKLIIRERLNPLFKVEKLVEIDQLPRTASGKVMRRKLRDLYLET
ncbi:AMP-binding protein [Lutimonas halocynthiae]|uniref:AMP-binding protein n=1 Tax=Lutimonas halocynthiae TaxID=1446477 RepID=UPI0025B5D7B2|nr:AMP-binding protein [Lutimonas halocynthiae]MDN3641570.1 AMP-binding protein [Lutimonas halocynthiae]